jgi:hypothetical protein
MSYWLDSLFTSDFGVDRVVDVGKERVTLPESRGFTLTRKASGAFVAAVLSIVAMGSVVLLAPPASAELSPQECAALVAEGEQAREDLAKLIESQGPGGDTTETTSEAIGSYVEGLLESAAINAFGFVSADAGAPLDLCLPKGTDTLTMFCDGDPIVLWEGNATFDAFPVTVQIPADAGCCGTQEMVATGPGVNERVSFTVAGECAVAGSSIPRTGAEIGGLLAIGLGCLAIGYAAIRGRRARVGG